MLAPGTHVGPYEIIAHLGSGGMGEVYKARDSTLGRSVALKILPELAPSPHSTERFEQEAKAASSLAHPNVCHIYLLGSTPEGRQFIAMEYVPGETLRSRLNRERLGLKEALGIAIQIGSALVASHAAGVVHRDIKPENVMITTDGLVKVLDFGLAKFRAPFSSDIESTRTVAQTDAGTVVGTVAYMSPEQARAQAVDARTDLWSLAVVLFEMAAGRPPFAGPSGSDVVAAILDREPMPLVASDARATPELQRIISKALRKSREERYQTAKDLLLDLKALRASCETPSGPTPPGLESGKWRSLIKRVAIATVLAVVVGGSAAAWLYRKRFLDASPTEVPTKLRQITRDAGLTFTPAITRDGRLIAYASDRTADQLDIWVQQVAGGDPVQVTHDESNDYQPTFSPDGATIVFRSSRKGGGVYLVSALGGAETFLAPKGLDPRFSPDGNAIVYWTGIEGSGDPSSPEWGQVFVVDRSGGKPRRIAAQHRGRHPIWAPDGKQVLFLSALQTRLDWCLATLATDDVSCLEAEKVIGEHQHLAASDWVDNRLLYQADAGESADVWQVRIKADYSSLIGPPVRVTYGSGEEVSPTFGARSQILFADVRSTPDIWSVALDPVTGSSSTVAERQLTRDQAMERNVSATRDGSKLLYTSNRSSTPDLWLRDLRTGSETRLTTGERTGWGLIHASGTRAAYERLLPTHRALRVIDVASQQNDEVCGVEWCGSPMGWTSDGKWILTQLGTSIRAVNISTKRGVDILKRAPYRLWQPHLSPDDQWVAFVVKPAGNDGRIDVAPFRGERPVAESEWQTVANTGSEDKPRWSDDGRVIYFTSERDGFRCVWGQRFDPAVGKITGEAFAAHHSHRPRLAMKALPLAPFDIWVAKGQLFFNQLERTGNIWLLEPQGR